MKEFKELLKWLKDSGFYIDIVDPTNVMAYIDRETTILFTYSRQYNNYCAIAVDKPVDEIVRLRTEYIDRRKNISCYSNIGIWAYYKLSDYRSNKIHIYNNDHTSYEIRYAVENYLRDRK